MKLRRLGWIVAVVLVLTACTQTTPPEGLSGPTFGTNAFALETLTEKVVATPGSGGAYFGSQLTLSDDGQTAAISAFLENGLTGAVYIYELVNNTWTFQQKLTASDAAPDDQFGVQPEFSADGETLVVGAYQDDEEGTDAGAAYIFRLDTVSGNWIEEAKLTGSDGTSYDRYGVASAISHDADIVVVGALRDANRGSSPGKAYVYRYDVANCPIGLETNGWCETAILTSSDGGNDAAFGSDVSLSADGSLLLIGALRAPQNPPGNSTQVGAAYVFEFEPPTCDSGFDTDGWCEVAKLVANSPQVFEWFGREAELNDDGTVALIGAPADPHNASNTSGAAYVFTESGGVWAQQVKFVLAGGMNGDRFGVAVDLDADGDTAIVGAETRNNQSAGAAYIYAFDGATWVEQSEVVPADGQSGDFFGIGTTVDSSGRTFLVGSLSDTDANGDPVGNRAGAAYAFFDRVPLSDFVVLGHEGVWLEQNATITSGNVGADESSPGPYLAAGSEVTIGVSVDILDPASQVFGDTLKLKSGSTVQDVFYNELDSNGTILGSAITPLDLPLVAGFPEVPTFSAGSNDVFVANGGSVTLAAGSYGVLDANQGATVTLTGGTYDFAEWDVGKNVTVSVEAPSEIRIAGRLALDQGSTLTPNAGMDATDIVVFVLGQNGNSGNLGGTPRAAKFGRNSVVTANVYAPNGTVWLRQGSEATGAFLGRWVIVGKSVTVTHESGFTTFP